MSKSLICMLKSGIFIFPSFMFNQDPDIVSMKTLCTVPFYAPLVFSVERVLFAPS